MKYNNVRNRLISSTISVLASEGFDRTTTKTIAKGSEIPEAYIYQHFADKEELLKITFDVLDDELLSILMSNINVMYVKELDIETRCRLYFTPVWSFLLGNSEKCISFIRYFYSPYFKKYSESEHEKRYAVLTEKCRELFNPNANVWMILNHILNVMLDFAIKVFDGAVSDSNNTAEHVFRLVYFSISPYFKSNNQDGKEVGTS